MGNFKSHLSNNSSVDEIEDSGDGNGDGMSTPLPGDKRNSEGLSKAKLMALLDPRSPTIGVSRTPVEVAAERERTRQERAKKLAVLGLANANEVSTPPAFDPRSPTLDYKRTPIAFDGPSDRSETPMDQQILDEGNENELQVPVNPVIRDLRKRLFVSQINDSLNAGIQDDNKEN